MRRTVTRAALAGSALLIAACGDDGTVTRGEAISIIEEQTLADGADALCIVDGMVAAGLDLDHLVDETLPDGFERAFHEIVAGCVLG
jgi:hypothetical protein